MSHPTFAWVIPGNNSLRIRALSREPGAISLAKKTDEHYTVTMYGESVGYVNKTLGQFFSTTPMYKYSLTSAEITAKDDEGMKDQVRQHIIDCLTKRDKDYKDIVVGVNRIAAYHKASKKLYLFDNVPPLCQNPVNRFVVTTSDFESHLTNITGKPFVK